MSECLSDDDDDDDIGDDDDDDDEALVNAYANDVSSHKQTSHSHFSSSRRPSTNGNSLDQQTT